MLPILSQYLSEWPFRCFPLLLNLFCVLILGQFYLFRSLPEVMPRRRRNQNVGIAHKQLTLPLKVLLAFSLPLFSLDVLLRPFDRRHNRVLTGHGLLLLVWFSAAVFGEFLRTDRISVLSHCRFALNSL